MLLEREGLLESLRERLDDAKSGNGSLVLVAGEAGAGKTSLVRAFVEGLDDSTLVIEGACDPLTTPRPLSPLHDFAADPAGGLEDLVREDREPIEMFEEVLDRLHNTIRPIALVIEDAHWADEGTLDFLRFIGRRVGNTKGMVVCTYRDDEVGSDHPLRPVLGQLIPLASTERLSIPPLSDGAVATLSRESQVDPAELHRVSGGNAFFVTEVLATGTLVPPTVQDAVLGRVGRLDDEARRAVEGVSIAPRSLEVDKVSALVGASPEAVDRAVGSGVLQEERFHLRFRHELARAAMEQAIPPARRQRLHRQMISLLAEDPQLDHARLAHHAIKAEAPAQIIEYAPEAARDARARGATREAVAFFQAALTQEGQMDGDEVAGLKLELGVELTALDEDERAIEVLEGAEAHFRRIGDLVRQAEAIRQTAKAFYGLGDMEEVGSRTREAIGVLEPLGETEHLAMALGSLASQHMLARRPSEGLPLAKQAERMAEATGSSELTVLTIRHTVACLEVVGGDVDTGLELLKESVEDTRGVDPKMHAMALTNLGSGAGEMRRYEVAVPALQEGEAHGLRNDLDTQVLYSRSWLARVAFEQGRWDEAVEHAALVEKTVSNRAGYSLLTALGVLGRVRVRRGDPGGRELLEETLTAFAGHNLQYRWSPAGGLAEFHWLRGSTDAMVDVLAELYERALETESQWARGELGYWMWKAGAIEGPPEDAAEPFWLQMADKWREAAASWRKLGCPYEVGLALMESGDAEPMLEALGIFDSIGARPIGDMLRSRLREAGVASIPRGPAPSTRQNPAALTKRQMEVLELMRDGLSNAEVAGKLFISKKTVEHHVSAIYSKLGVASRARAIAVARDVI